jgi:hypothetical protein
MIPIALMVLTTTMCVAVSPAVAQQIRVGTLSCRLPPGAGAEPRMRCILVNARGRTELYSGTVTRFAPGVAIDAGGTLRWSVRAATRVTRRGALAGDYVEAGGTSGAKVLIGGSQQPLMLRSRAVRSSSARARSGIDLAAAVTRLTIRHRSE